MDYACTVWGNCQKQYRKKIQRLQNYSARIVLNNFDYENYNGIDLVPKLGWLTYHQKYKHLMSVLMFKVINGMAPNNLSVMI